MRSVEVVEVLPSLELLVEEAGVVDDDAFEEPVKLLLVDPVRSLDLPVQTRCGRSDVEVADPAVEEVPMEGTLELGAVVSLDDFDLEGEPFEQVVEELDGGLLVTAWIRPKHSDPGAVVDGGELVVLLAPRAPDGLDELHVHLDPLARELFLVALVAVLVALVALRGREPRHPELVEDPPDARRADFDVVVTLEVHGDLVGPEVVMAPQVDDARDHRWFGRIGQFRGAEDPSRSPCSPSSS
jgi:hypothetical protein